MLSFWLNNWFLIKQFGLGLFQVCLPEAGPGLFSFFELSVFGF